MTVATAQRDRVSAIAATKPTEALSLARAIADPWFRCQALSMVAVHLTDRRTRISAIDEALRAANELVEPNRVASVSAWAIKALALCEETPRLDAETARLLTIIATEPSPVRRLDALRLLLGSVIATRSGTAREVAQAFAAACLAPLASGQRNRKGESCLEECLPAIAHLDAAFAERLRVQLPTSGAARAAQAIETVGNVSLAELVSWPNLSAR